MSDWQRVCRVGTPEVKPMDPPRTGIVSVSIGVVPTSPPEWKAWFVDKLRELGWEAQFNYRHGSDGEGLHVTAPEPSFESAVEAIDEAIDYANDEYEAQNLPFELEAKRYAADQVAAEEQRVRTLEDRAAKLAKPGEPIWEQYRRGDRR